MKVVIQVKFVLYFLESISIFNKEHAIIVQGEMLKMEFELV